MSFSRIWRKDGFSLPFLQSMILVLSKFPSFFSRLSSDRSKRKMASQFALCLMAHMTLAVVVATNVGVTESGNGPLPEIGESKMFHIWNVKRNCSLRFAKLEVIRQSLTCVSRSSPLGSRFKFNLTVSNIERNGDTKKWKVTFSSPNQDILLLPMCSSCSSCSKGYFYTCRESCCGNERWTIEQVNDEENSTPKFRILHEGLPMLVKDINSSPRAFLEQSSRPTKEWKFRSIPRHSET